MTDSCPEPLITHHHFHLAFCTKDHSLQGLGWFDNVRCWILSCSGPWLFVLPKDLVFYVTVQSVLNPAVSCDLCTNMKSKFYKSGLNLFTFAPNGLTQFLRSMKYCRNYTKAPPLWDGVFYTTQIIAQLFLKIFFFFFF